FATPIHVYFSPPLPSISASLHRYIATPLPGGSLFFLFFGSGGELTHHWSDITSQVGINLFSWCRAVHIDSLVLKPVSCSSLRSVPTTAVLLGLTAPQCTREKRALNVSLQQ
ncbi:unnamed protein product, partial [Ectocarpus sp. 8 AP-2014]